MYYKESPTSAGCGQYFGRKGVLHQRAKARKDHHIELLHPGKAMLPSSQTLRRDPKRCLTKLTRALKAITTTSLLGGWLGHLHHCDGCDVLLEHSHFTSARNGTETFLSTLTGEMCLHCAARYGKRRVSASMMAQELIHEVHAWYVAEKHIRERAGKTGESQSAASTS